MSLNVSAPVIVSFLNGKISGLVLSSPNTTIFRTLGVSELGTIGFEGDGFLISIGLS